MTTLCYALERERLAKLTALGRTTDRALARARRVLIALDDANDDALDEFLAAHPNWPREKPLELDISRFISLSDMAAGPCLIRAAQREAELLRGADANYMRKFCEHAEQLGRMLWRATTEAEAVTYAEYGPLLDALDAIAVEVSRETRRSMRGLLRAYEKIDRPLAVSLVGETAVKRFEFEARASFAEIRHLAGLKDAGANPHATDVNEQLF